MNMKSIEDVFIHLLSDTYSAEKQLTRGLAKLARAASSEKLSAAFNAHLEETQGQIERIDQIIEQESGLKIKRMKCVAMEGLIEEANEVVESTEKNEVRDAALIAAAQKVEHYEIASYGTLVTLAEQLGYKKAVKLLAETLEEEKQTDVKLTDLAVGNSNKKSIGGMFPSDEIVKGSISGYVFEQFEIACYTSLLAAAEKAGDTASIPAIEAILAEEREMADWLIKHIPQTTEQFLLRSDADGVEAKK